MMSDENEQNKSPLIEWLKTVPGILAAIGALLGSIGAFIVILYNTGFIQKHDPFITRDTASIVNPPKGELHSIFNLDSIGDDAILDDASTRTNDKNDNPNSAYEFDGQTSSVKISAKSLLKLKDFFTVVAIIKNSGSPDHAGIVKFYDEPSNKGWQISLSQNNLRIDIGYGDHWDAIPDHGHEIKETDGWTLMAFTYDKITNTEGRVILYLNGNVRLESTTHRIAYSGIDYLILGEDTADKTINENRHFKGVIDNVIVYDRMLSSNEIASLYKILLPK